MVDGEVSEEEKAKPQAQPEEDEDEDTAAYDDDDFEEISEDENLKVTKSFGEELRQMQVPSEVCDETLPSAQVPAVDEEPTTAEEPSPNVAVSLLPPPPAPASLVPPVSEAATAISVAKEEEPKPQQAETPAPAHKPVGADVAPVVATVEEAPVALAPVVPTPPRMEVNLRPHSGRRRAPSRMAEAAAQPTIPAATPQHANGHASRRPRPRAAAESPSRGGDGTPAGSMANAVMQFVPPVAGVGVGGLSRLDGEDLAEFESSPPVRTVSASSGSSAAVARRVVRGKVSVGEEKPDRPPTTPGPGEANAGQAHGPEGRADPSRPMWLQGGVNREPLHNRSWDRELGFGANGGASSPPLGSVLRGRGHCNDMAPPRPGAGGARDGSRRRSHATESMFGSEPAEASSPGRQGSCAPGDDRKAKRLQQEVQRLQQRLQECELFSAQDDGLPRFVLDEVELGSQIAQGGFSSVHRAVWHGTPCAIKKIFDPVITEELRAEFENEVRMLRRLRHPHVVTLMAVCRVPPALSILTEFVEGGSVFELLHCRRHPSAQARRPERDPWAILPLVRQAANALAYMHAMLVVHRDVKTQNVLLTAGSCPSAKLCDFGLARMRSELGTGAMQWAGTAQYMAPELFAKRRYTESVDVFAFGVMVWEVVASEIPHANMEAEDIAHRVQHKEYAGLGLTPSWPKSLKSFLKACLAVNADDRPSMAEAAKNLLPVLQDFPPPGR